VQKIDDTHFVIERKWAMGEAVNVKLVSQKRRGIVFDGVNDYIELAQPLPIFSSSFTISMWVKVPANSDRGILLGDYQLPQSINVNFEVFNGKLRFYWNGEPIPYLVGSQDLRDNQWHFISFVRDRENQKISGYIDGVLDFEYSGEVSDKRAVIAHRIGRDSREGVTNFEGQIADLRIWKVARTAAEIKNNMYLQLTGKEVGLVGYWRLGAIAEGKVVDFSVNCNDGNVYGEPYVSAATLNRKLAGGTVAVKYSNSELFAVSERATYTESFEFKVNSANPVDLAYLDNADGKNIGTKIFTLSYWGKTSRTAEEKKTISAVQNKFEDLGNGWYRASCNVTIPDEVSLLRSFEIANVHGDWESLEIRKHRIRLLSDSITEAKYTDGVTLASLVDDHATLAAKLKALELKEKQEIVLLKEKQDLQDKLAKLNNLDATIAQKDALSLELTKLRQQKNDQQITYEREKSNPANYVWYVENKGSGLALTHWVDALFPYSFPYSLFPNTLVFLPRANRGDFQWTFVDQGDGWFIIKIVANNGGLRTFIATSVYMCRNGENEQGEHWGALMGDPYLRQYPDRCKFKLIDAGDGCYYIQIKETKRFLSQGVGSVYKHEVRFTRLRLNNDYEKFRLTKVAENSLNEKVENLLKSLNDLEVTLQRKEQELANLIEIINEGTKKKSLWENRLKEVIAQLTTLQTEINTLNTDFLNAVKNIQAKPQAMPQVAKDSKGLVTQGALLGFVQTASRLNAIETCEGNVQLSYLDSEGRMRQTNYDATADGKNSAFEQWIPDAQRACLNFSNNNSVVKLNQALYLTPDWSIEAWFVYPLPETAEWNTLVRGTDADHHILVRNRKQLGIYLTNDSLGQNFYDSGFNMESLTEGWHHVAAVGLGDTTLFYIDGKKVGDVKAKALKDAEDNLNKNPNDAAAKKKVEDIKKASLKSKSDVYAIGNYTGGGQNFGKLAEVRVWGVALSDDEIAVNSTILLSGNEPGLLAYYPMSEATGVEVRDHSGNGNNATVSGANWWGCTAPIGKINNPSGADALVCAEYSTVTVESSTKTKVAIMRRFFAYPATNGVTLLPDKRIETLELKWIGNAQFAPTLLGYIEGPPPVPSENLTLSDDYNGATSVELTMSEDVEFSWNRSQDSGLGGSIEAFAGLDDEVEGGIVVSKRIAKLRAGYKANFDFSYQFQNESSITSSSSLSMTDKLELRGTPEESTKFPHLGTRFIPKNIGYALVVSAIADVFVTRLARSGKMVGYQVQPVDGIPPDVNTITFLMNPAYTMNGSLDGMTGSSATSDRFFKHVPEMRSQYGSLYPASYYRLKEAYDLKRQIEAEDKRRESYFSNFDVRLVDETSLNRNIDSGDAPTTIGVQREEDKPGTQMTDEEKKKAEEEELQNQKAEATAKTKQQETASRQKQAEIQSKIGDQEKRVQATNSFAGWQKRMEDLQIRAGKRNIVNTYVWDADGGLRTEQQSFANTVEHTIGGSFGMNASLGGEANVGVAGAMFELSALATVNLTQTMNKTEARSKGFELNVDLSGLEYKGITDYNDRPILPGEKVDRYRFMSFYLEGSTNHFHDFFNYVVDPEWLRSNDEEAVALRQAQAGKPNKAWRVLHRVTYVERPALMGFGRDVRKLRAAAEISENQALLDKITKLEEKNQKLEEKLDTILSLLKEQK
jgi:hypothetical protein